MMNIKLFCSQFGVTRLLAISGGSLHRRSRTLGGFAVFGLLMVAFLAVAPMGRAQELSATLSGNVTDASGAVIPHAAITIVQNGVNGTARVVESDSVGNYLAPNLTAGNYSLTVKAAGFQTFAGKNIVLNVAEKHSFNIQLKTGAVTETVTVEDNPVQVDTETASQAGTISGVQVRELELSSRNFEQLLVLQPGVISAGLGDEASAANTGVVINGARNSANNWTVDGADINDSGSNNTVVNTPSVDAIQEFTLERGNYDAGYGRSGGGQILVATKAGTSSFHGDAYEFVRNTIFDANEYFNKMNQIANGEPNKDGVNHHNFYGFTIGGPIFVPKVYNTKKDKTFFFWSEEWHKQSTPGSASMPAPSAFNLAGGFNIAATAATSTSPLVPAVNPYPASCVTGWTVDASGNGSGTILPACYSANSKVYLTNVFDKYQANQGSQYFFGYSATNDLRDDIVRVDHYFNDKLHFYARGMNDDMPVAEPMGLWAGNNYPGLVNTTVDSPGKNVVGNLTWTISPKVVNEFEFVWAQGTYGSAIAAGQFATSSTVNAALTPGTAVYTDPYGRVPNVTIVGVTGFSAGSAPWKERNLDRTYFDNLSYQLGKHNLRAGFQFQQMIKTENATEGNPNYSFNSWGDFLVGDVATFSQNSRDVIPDLHYVNSEAYVNDDWKINTRLTVNLGLRWSFFPSVTDVKDTLLGFDSLLYNATNAPKIDPVSGNIVAGTATNAGNYANGLIFPTGDACKYAQTNALFAQCSPYGEYVNPNNKANFAPRLGFAFNPDGKGVTSIRGGFGIFYDRVLNGIWEQNAFANPIYAPATTINNGKFDNIKSGTPAGASYGPNGLTSTGIPDFKVPDYANYNLSVQRQLLPTTTVEVAYVGNIARHLLGEYDQNQPTVSARTSAATTTNVNAIRPFLGYAAINTRSPLFTSNYNSLQVSLAHRSSKGLTLGAAYTWSKILTTNASDRSNEVTDIYNAKMDYGPSNLNTPQVLEVNYIYTLPFFKEQHGFEGRILGGWELSGVTSMVSGSNFSALQGLDPWVVANGSGNGIGLGATRLDQVGSIHMNKTRTSWFSTSSFATASGHFGSERANPILGPGLQNWDLATIKNIKIAEHISFQLRGEYFNAFNHENFETVDATKDDGASFGTVTAGHEPRRIQLAAKLYF
jgi:hypothetical protein